MCNKCIYIYNNTVLCVYSQVLPQFIEFEISFNKNLTAIEIHIYIYISITPILLTVPS
jgi:hypothetical protein